MGWGMSEDESHQAMTHQSGGWVSHLSEILSRLAAHWYQAVPNTVRFLKKWDLILAYKYKKKIQMMLPTTKKKVLFCGFCVM